jgi:hypothetical protein
MFVKQICTPDTSKELTQSPRLNCQKKREQEQDLAVSATDSGEKGIWQVLKRYPKASLSHFSPYYRAALELQ